MTVDKTTPSDNASVVTITGAFGAIVVDTSHPQIIELWLRETDGGLSPKSLLSQHPPNLRDWAVGGYSYVGDCNGVRYESRRSCNHTAVVEPGRILFKGVALVAEDGSVAPVREDWDISLMPGGELSWTVTRRWIGEFRHGLSGAPALFFASRPNEKAFFDLPPGSPPTPGPFLTPELLCHRRERARYVNPAGNGVITSIWFQREALQGRWDPLYSTGWSNGAQPHPMFAQNLCVTVTQPHAWAVVKLYTGFPMDVDLRLQATGHLYRRGAYDQFSELGATRGIALDACVQSGDVEITGLVISAKDKRHTAYQLCVSLPEPEIQRALEQYYNGLLGGGAMCDQSTHDIGNETDGFRVGFTPQMAALAMTAGVPGPHPASSCPVTVADAIAECINDRIHSLDDRGALIWGFTHEPGRPILENQMGLALAAERWLVHTGRADVVHEWFGGLERAIDLLARMGRDNDGLVRFNPDPSVTVAVNWYMDGIKANGTLAAHNVFYHAALAAMADIALAVGREDRVPYYRGLAERVHEAFNRRFWSDNACGAGKGAYYDWIDLDDRPHAYFMSPVQYPAIALGLASPGQARAILATADTRLQELARLYDYRGAGTLDCLWPIPQDLIVGHQLGGFGYYMNGGMLLTWTYYEIVARAMSGDAEGAYARLSQFARHAARTNWFEGENSFTIDGRPYGWGSEPYLFDQITVPAALLNGILGVRMNWREITATPVLPACWPNASAEVMYKGQRWHIEAAGRLARIARKD